MREGWWEEMVDTAVDNSGHSRRAVHWGEGGIAKRRLALQATLAEQPIGGRKVLRRDK